MAGPAIKLHARSHTHGVAGDGTALAPASIVCSGSITLEGNLVLDSDSGTIQLGEANDLTLSRLAAGALLCAHAPAASANRGVLNLGSGPFDGASAGFFAGSASGTVLAVNAASGFVGNLLDLQTAGARRFAVSGAGQALIANGTAAAPSLAFGNFVSTGLYNSFGGPALGVSVNGTFTSYFDSNALGVKRLYLGATPNTPDIRFHREAAGITGIHDFGTTVQALHLYETTDGPPGSNYSRLALRANATARTIASEAGGSGTVRKLVLDPGTSDIQWNKALVALGGGAAPTLGTIGGSGPATAAQDSWMRVLDSAGVAFWVPAWK